MNWSRIGVHFLFFLGLAGLVAILGVLIRRSGRRLAPGANRFQFIGNLLLTIGITSLAFVLVAYLIEYYGSDHALPAPVALTGEDPEGPATAALTPTSVTQTTYAAITIATAAVISEGTLTAVSTPTAVASLTPTVTPTAAPTPAKPGVPVRLVISSIDVDSAVQEVGTYWENRQLLWETVPFVVGHYRTTARAGEMGNAVFSGHVSSRNAGNVFKDLYRIRLEDEVYIYTADTMFVYVVTDVRLVLPTETSVMDTTPDATATLITCAGEWIPSKRVYSHRLIVTTKLKR